MTQFRALLDSYFKNQHSFGNPLLEHSKTDQSNTLDVLLKLFQQARDALEQDYGLDLNRIVFFYPYANTATNSIPIGYFSKSGKSIKTTVSVQQTACKSTCHVKVI